MLTAEERRLILNTRCPWGGCHSTVGEECWFKGPGGRPMRITTLEGGFHDARVQAALGRGARVVTTDPTTGRTRVAEPPSTAPEREPVPLAALTPTGPSDRPW